MLDAIELIKEPFDEVTPDSIGRCWLRAKCLHEDVAVSLNACFESGDGVAEQPADEHARAIVDILVAVWTYALTNYSQYLPRKRLAARGMNLGARTTGTWCDHLKVYSI